MTGLQILGVVSGVVGIASFVWYLYDKRSPYRRLSWRTAQSSAKSIAERLVSDGFSPSLIFGIGRGGAVFGSLLSGCLGHRPLVVVDRTYDWSESGRAEDILVPIELPRQLLENVLLVAGEAHSGATMKLYYDFLRSMGAQTIRRAVLLLEDGCTASIEYSGVKTPKKNLVLPWMFSPRYRRDDRTPAALSIREPAFSIRMHLARHAETAAGEDHFAGTSDFDLTETGVSQAVELGRQLSLFRIVDIIASPAGRAMKTARIVGGCVHGASVQVDHRLREADFGRWDGASREEIRTEHGEEYQAWLDDPVENPPPGAETAEEVLERVRQFLADVEVRYASHPRAELVVISHKTTARIMLCHLLGMELKVYRSIEMQNATPVVIVFDGTAWSLIGEPSGRSTGV